MKIETSKTTICGAFCFSPKSHCDTRGSLTEIFRTDWLGSSAMKPKQANLSVSKKGVLRGLHYHHQQTDYWFCVRGGVRVMLVDLRQGSPTWRESYTTELYEDDPQLLVIPSGVAHGYYALSNMALIYFVDALYDGTDEQGVLWCDKDLSLPWKINGSPIVSERDRKNPEFCRLFEKKSFPKYKK